MLLLHGTDQLQPVKQLRKRVADTEMPVQLFASKWEGHDLSLPGSKIGWFRKYPNP